MTKYRVYSGNKQFTIIDNSDKMVIVDSIYDNIILSFNESTQKFHAQIVNPSSHTLYLLEKGRLGISLCKRNTGNKSNYRRIKKLGPYKYKKYVKRTYHTYWTRVKRNFTKITSLSQLKNGIDLNVFDFDDIYNFRPHNEQHHPNWYTTIKATFVSAPNSNIINNSWQVTGCRSYKTNCNKIPVIYNKLDQELNFRRTGLNISFTGEYLDGDTQSGYRFRITAHNVTDYWRGQDVDICLAADDCSSDGWHGRGKTAHNGNDYIRHYIYLSHPRSNRHVIGTIGSFHLQEGGSTIITIPGEQDMTRYYPQRCKTFSFMFMKHNNKYEFQWHSKIYIQLVQWGGTKIQCSDTGTASFDTGFKGVWKDWTLEHLHDKYGSMYPTEFQYEFD